MQDQIQLAKNLIHDVRHLALATANADGTPHNSPLMRILSDDLKTLYIGSHKDSLHVKNLLRTGKGYAVLYDSNRPGMGGVYLTCANARLCVDDELRIALSVHNKVRAHQDKMPIDLAYYAGDESGQGMYALDITLIEIYAVERLESGLISHEVRRPISSEDLLG